MKRSAILFAVLGMVLALASAAQAQIITSPQDDYTGPYRLAFFTTDTFSPTNTDIEVYNDSVSLVATNVAELVALTGTTWKAIASTETVNARANTLTVPSVDPVTTLQPTNYNSATDFPIYNLSGVRLADNNLDLWDDNTLADVMTDDAGVRPIPGTVHPAIMTGTKSDGTLANFHNGSTNDLWLGTTGPDIMISNMHIDNVMFVGGWIMDYDRGSSLAAAGFRLMAMSSVIPATGVVGTIVEIK